MKILAIETSCDETAVAVVEAVGTEQSATFTVLGNALLSQTVHAQYGGVFPALAKREHAKNLVPILEAALEEAEMVREDTQVIPDDLRAKISEILAREPGLVEAFFEFVTECEPPAIDAVAVTVGPGLEPALWVGINFARALALVWDKPLVAVNHMEGHILAALAEPRGEQFSISNFQFPILALLISGGHTELVVMKKWPRRADGRGPDQSVGAQYELIGQTRDDAVGEAFDKVARMLALPYPGGPHISALAESARKEAERTQTNAEEIPRDSASVQRKSAWTLPRPMMHEDSCDFSFAGLKTAVLYLLKERAELNEREKQELALEFENAVTDVLWHKTARALRETGAQTLVIGGGVSSNQHIRRVFSEKILAEFPTTNFRLPTQELTTDNAIMIALAGYYHAVREEFVPPPFDSLKASGNLSLAKEA